MPSKNWIIVYEGNKIIAEIPFEGSPSQALIEAETTYPRPVYSLEYVCSSVPTATGTEILKGWDHDGFDEHDARTRDKQEQ